MTQIQKPSIKSVLAQQEEKFEQLLEGIHKKENLLYDDMNHKIEAAEREEAQGLLHLRQQKVVDLDQTDQEIQDLYEKIYELEEKKKQIASDFKKAAKAVKSTLSSTVREAKKAIKGDLKEFDDQIDAARKEERKAIFNAVAATIDYKVYSAKVTLARTFNGLGALFSGKSFKDGYKAEPKIKVPNSLKPKQDAPAAP